MSDCQVYDSPSPDMVDLADNLSQDSMVIARFPDLNRRRNRKKTPGKDSSSKLDWSDLTNSLMLMQNKTILAVAAAVLLVGGCLIFVVSRDSSDADSWRPAPPAASAPEAPRWNGDAQSQSMIASSTSRPSVTPIKLDEISRHNPVINLSETAATQGASTDLLFETPDFNQADQPQPQNASKTADSHRQLITPEKTPFCISKCDKSPAQLNGELENTSDVKQDDGLNNSGAKLSDGKTPQATADGRLIKDCPRSNSKPVANISSAVSEESRRFTATADSNIVGIPVPPGDEEIVADIRDWKALSASEYYWAVRQRSSAAVYQTAAKFPTGIVQGRSYPNHQSLEANTAPQKTGGVRLRGTIETPSVKVY